MNSLCGFDFLQFLLQEVYAEPNSAEGYPASTDYSYERIRSIVDKVKTDEKMRKELFPEIPDARIDEAVNKTLQLALRQSQALGNSWAM